MKIAFHHSQNEYANQLFTRLRDALAGHEFLSWPMEQPVPAKDIRVLLALSPITRAQMAPLSELELVQTLSAGFDSIDVDAANDLGIWVSNAPAGLTGNAESVAEFAVMLLIGASRHLMAALRSETGQTPFFTTSNQALFGKTACIVGLGSIGRRLVDRLRPFGMTLIATDAGTSSPPAGVTLYPAHELKRAVATANYIVICIPGSRENENLIDASVLGAMQRGAILVNVARGNVVDEDALCAALRSGQVAAVGLDVLRTEPAKSDNLLAGFTQALITPHIAGQTDLTLSGTLHYIAKVIHEWDSGNKPESVINQPPKPRKRFDD